MNMKFHTLTLQCRKSKEVIEFSPQISFFHGQISTGKSSIARLIDFCLGSDVVKIGTTAINRELVSVELTAHIGEYNVLFEREAKKSNQVQVTWQDADGRSASVLAPIEAQSGAGPIWDNNVFNLTDLIFYLFGITPIKVKRSKRDQDSPLVRLSFRDIMWYCYLDQDHLDSSFFRLEDKFRGLKSRDVMRFVVGFYTERLNDLEINLEEIKDQRAGKLEAAEQLKTSLQELGYDSESKIGNEIRNTTVELRKAKSEQLKLREGYMENTHFADRLRKQLRALSIRLTREEQALTDLNERIDEQKTLKAELFSAKFKLARAKSASTVLSGVSFEFCPSCGMKLDTASQNDTDVCPLCGKQPSTSREQIIPQGEMLRDDLNSRIEELDESIQRHTESLKKEKFIVSELQEKKALLDEQLKEELKNYDSTFLASSREVERRIATLQERLRGLEKILRIPNAIVRLEEEADKLVSEEARLKRKIQEEKAKLTSADQYIQDIEDSFLQSLIEVGVPGVGPDDQVELNRKTWIPSVLPEGDKALKWYFYNAGSGGKKTLFNVCYALAVHKVADEHDLPLPTFLIIDTPMKNIGKDVNRDIFVAFYNYLYDLVVGPLSNTQFIIIDKECVSPSYKEIIFKKRYMSNDDLEHPPLISYYRGP
jgi:rubrerythrin